MMLQSGHFRTPQHSTRARSARSPRVCRLSDLQHRHQYSSIAASHHRPVLAREVRILAPSKLVNTPARHVLLHSLAPTGRSISDLRPASRSRAPRTQGPAAITGVGVASESRSRPRSVARPGYPSPSATTAHARMEARALRLAEIAATVTVEPQRWRR